jgi:hypothetical protein
MIEATKIKLWMMRRDLAISVAIWLLVFAVYCLSSGVRLTRLTGYGHYISLAQSMLAGRLTLSETKSLDDLVDFEGEWYVAFPPLPALLLLPWVAISSRANPVVFTATIAALNVVLMRLLLRRAVPRMGVRPEAVSWLTAAFAFGTAHWYITATGTVWHTAQICGLAFLLGAVIEAMGRGRPWLCGLLLGIAINSRPPIGFTLPFFVPLVLAAKHRWRAALGFLAPLAACVGLFAVYNIIRFDSPVDFGYTRMHVGAVLAPHLKKGLFSLSHIPLNAWHGLILPPLPTPRFPFIGFHEYGNSFLLVSPFLLLAFRRWPQGVWPLGCWAAIVLTLLVDLSYFSSGYAQRGYRYSLDVTTFLVLLAGAGYSRRLGRALVILAITIQIAGVITYLNWPRMWSQIFG